jgi:hypothetical protein
MRVIQKKSVRKSPIMLNSEEVDAFDDICFLLFRSINSTYNNDWSSFQYKPFTNSYLVCLLHLDHNLDDNKLLLVLKR